MSEEYGLKFVVNGEDYDKIKKSLNEQIEDLQQKVEQLEKELQITANNCKQLENIRKEAIKATKDVKQFVYDELVDRNVSGATETHCKIMDLLNILNKGE